MSASEMSQTEEMLEITEETLLPLVKPFFKRMTVGQLELLQTCAPDNTTKIMMVDLLLNIISTLSEVWLMALGSKNEVVSEDQITCGLGNKLSKCFAAALNAEDQVECPSSDSLISLLVIEVTENVNSALSTTVRTADPVITQRITPPRRINDMVDHACNMVKVFTSNMKMMCPTQCQRQRTRQTPSQDDITIDDVEQAEAGNQEELRGEDMESTDNDYLEELEKDDMEPADSDDEEELDTKDMETDDTVEPKIREKVSLEDTAIPTMKAASHVRQMVKVFTDKMKILCPIKKQRQRTRQTLSQAPAHTDELKEPQEGDVEPAHADDLEPDDMELETQGKVSSEDTVFEIPTMESVERIIQKEVTQMIEPLLDEVPDSKYELLKRECSEEIEVVAADIARTIAEMDRTDDESRISKQKRKLSLKEIGSRIKTFFATCLAKAWFHRMLENLRIKFHKDSNNASRPLIPTKQGVDSLPQEDIKPQVSNIVGAITKFKDISTGKSLEFAQQAIDLIFRDITDGIEIMPKLMRKNSLCSKATVPQSLANIYAEIQKKVWNYMGLMGWWMNTQVSSHSKRLKDAIMDAESLAPKHVSEGLPIEEPVATVAASGSVCEETYAEHAQETAAQEIRKRLSVKIILDKLVSRIFTKAKVNWAIGNPDDMVNRLFEKTWAMVEDVGCDSTQRNFQNLDKAIFQDLCKRWGCAERMLISLHLEEPVLENSIVSSFKDHLMTPSTKCCTIRRFFSSVGKAISNICYSRNRVAVM